MYGCHARQNAVNKTTELQSNTTARAANGVCKGQPYKISRLNSSTLPGVYGQRRRIVEAIFATFSTSHRLSHTVQAANMHHVVLLFLEYLAAKLTRTETQTMTAVVLSTETACSTIAVTSKTLLFVQPTIFQSI